MPSSKIKIGGAYSGILEVDLESWTLSMLREEIVRRSHVESGNTVNLICGGKILKECDESKNLIDLGLKNSSKVLATVVSKDKRVELDRELASEEERSSKLIRLKAAAVALTERHAKDGALPIEDYSVELEDQSGQKIKLGTETDQRGAMMGLMLHTNGKSLIEKQKYKDALDVLLMAEESFSLCDPKFIEMVDNVPMLQLDIVWCYFMLRDISCLSVAGERLLQARKGLEKSHGKDSSRLRLLQDARSQELAIYLRLELLEGVVFFHSGDHEKSRKALNSAQIKFNQLQVADETLSQLMNMGYKEKSAKRALRMSGQDIGSAVDFLVEERAKKNRRYEENLKRQEEIREQKMYGVTPLKKAVDIGRLNELVTIGFERALAAEALRVNENDTQLALDLLTNPEENGKLQRKIELRKEARIQRKNTVQEGSSSAAATEEEATFAEAKAVTADTDLSFGEAEASAVVSSKNKKIRDTEMEDELVDKLKGDAIEDYDIEVDKEGEAIAEYLSHLDCSVQNNGSSSHMKIS